MHGFFSQKKNPKTRQTSAMKTLGISRKKFAEKESGFLKKNFFSLVAIVVLLHFAELLIKTCAFIFGKGKNIRKISQVT